MRRSFLAALVVVMAGTVGGCTSGVQPIDPITQMANRCSVATYDQGLRAGGINRLTSRMFLDGELAAWGGIYSGAVPVLNSRGLPVAEASALDDGKPGSAWAGCMQQSLSTVR